MKKIIEKRGITLISLVVTTIVILILAGITLNLVLNKNDGIINIAKKADKENSEKLATEKLNLKITNSQINSWAKSQRMPTLQELANDLCEDNEIQYVALESQKIASLEKIEVGKNNSIFTKLKDYPYEFEINSSLQLASIDGIETATGTTQTTNSCNPKLLTTLVLPSTQKNSRAVGTYFANTTNFTKTNTEDFNTYLTYDETKGWIVLKGGNYLINTYLTAWGKTQTDTTNYIKIDGVSICLTGLSSRNGDYDTNGSNLTIYLEEGTTLDFYNDIKIGSPTWHSANFKIYALFK